MDKPMELPGGESGPERPNLKNVQRKKKVKILGKRSLIIIGIVLLVGALGFTAWKVIPKIGDGKQELAPNNSKQESAPAEGAVESDIPEAPLSELHTGDHPRIEFNYPKTWTITEVGDGVRVESPEFSYMTSNQGSVTGNFRIYIRTGARQQDSKYIGQGVAIKPSEKLTYAAPAVGQRSDTLLSSFGLGSPGNFAFFLIAGNFQLKEGDTLGPDYGKETDTYIIAGGYSSKDLGDDLATHTVPADMYNKTRAYTQALDIIKSLKLK